LLLSSSHHLLTVLAQVQIQNRQGQDCVAKNGFCPNWIFDNFDRYVHPFWQHVFLTLVSVAIGFVIAFFLALMAHRKRWLIPPLSAFSQVLYAIPSVALFLLLLPISGRGNLTALIALVSYTLIFVFVNVTTGLDGVPGDAVDAARGMGLTEQQLLWRVEVPLALPEILAGLRIATTTTVGLAALAFFAGAGGLGQEIYADINFKSNVVAAGALAILLAVVLDLLILGVQRALTPWRRATR
jgi:osmoprotectant transport system permease protein